MGAKICRLLDAIDPAPSSTFRQLLSLKMKFHQTEILGFLANETHKVRGTTLFLAELYIQLQNVMNSLLFFYQYFFYKFIF